MNETTRPAGRKRGRKPKPPALMLSLRLRPELHARFQRAKKDSGLSAPKFLNTLITRHEQTTIQPN